MFGALGRLPNRATKGTRRGHEKKGARNSFQIKVKEWCRRGESDDRSRTIREALVAGPPWEIRGKRFPRWLSFLSKETRKLLQPNLPLAAEFCMIHGFVFLVGNVYAERQDGRWRIHRTDGPAVVVGDQELYYWRGWQVARKTVLEKPSAERILKEENQTEREVLLQRMGVENFIREAELRPVDSFHDSTLLKVDTAEKRGHWQDNAWTEVPLPLAFLRVVCPSTQKTYFLRVEPRRREREAGTRIDAAGIHPRLGAGSCPGNLISNLHDKPHSACRFLSLAGTPDQMGAIRES